MAEPQLKCIKMKIGYARVSTADQNLDLQIDALKKAGCEQRIKDEISGFSTDGHPGYFGHIEYAKKLSEFLDKNLEESSQKRII